MALLMAVVSFGSPLVLIEALSASSSIRSIGRSIARPVGVPRPEPAGQALEDGLVLLGHHEHRLVDGAQRDVEGRRGVLAEVVILEVKTTPSRRPSINPTPMCRLWRSFACRRKSRLSKPMNAASSRSCVCRRTFSSIPVSRTTIR